MGDRDQGTDDAVLEFETLLTYLKHCQGCDLTGYRRTTLMRRFQHRMYHLCIDSYPDYLRYLQIHPTEHQALLGTVLINFTGFFRDRAIWTYLASHVIPRLLTNRPPNQPIRIWSAGCATGQEIYRLLILFGEILGIQSCLEDVQWLATDVDGDALDRAEQGLYSHFDVENVPTDLLQKYFESVPHGYRVDPDLQSAVQFMHHDIMRDAPFPAIDLLLCRNVLMYFTPEAQELILNHFYIALKQSGFLIVGQAEMLIHQWRRFVPVALKQQIYTKDFDSFRADCTSFRPFTTHNQAPYPYAELGEVY